MGVDRLRGLVEPHVQHDIGGLAAHAGQADQGGAAGGDFAAVVIHQNLAEFDDVLGLIAEKADGFDMLDHRFFAQSQHFGGGIGDFEQGPRGAVHPDIGRLR
jgi:hypothetical protein